ncbi:hypothetical protein JGS22_007815 [Streptomyces sp. P38-E01]|uniref:Secreted protein n=1 Tax=Streptomyces tardus TaxID=2780544 RepID=A0A949N7K3_9ACTN|nr:hypothetical protein [Streptomyces tardus]MBU7597531.1 hypothetical protein [Streptomyces tardus]
MNGISRRLRSAAVASGLALSVGVGVTAGTGVATAAPGPDRASGGAAATCYGSATDVTFAMGSDEAAHTFGPYWTANPRKCGDINLRITTWGNASTLRSRICFKPTSGNDFCVPWKGLKKADTLNKWRVLATDVIPGTKYTIQLDFASGTFRGKLAD